MVKLLDTWEEFQECLKDAGDKLVVVIYTAKWCGPCRVIAPKFETMTGDFPDAVFVRVDVDENAETAERQRVNCMPTFQFFKKTNKIHEFSGAAEDKLRNAIQSHV